METDPRMTIYAPICIFPYMLFVTIEYWPAYFLNNRLSINGHALFFKL